MDQSPRDEPKIIKDIEGIQRENTRDLDLRGVFGELMQLAIATK